MSRHTDSDVDELKTDTEPEYSISTGGEEEADLYGYEEPFRLRTEDYISRPFLSKTCDMDENILEFDFSYGYDCKKPYNLVVLDERTLIFACGNLIHFMDVETRQLWFRRSACGNGIGHIAKNPNPDYPHIAIAENGIRPPILIYEWPSLEIMCVLRGGTQAKYCHLNYSPDGELLVSQGGEPDYLITIWNWPKSVILLRSKSYVNDVYRVMFAPDLPKQLVSCGVSHIKFWKMCQTFTGLKLKGELGRFGKTEYSDIIGIYPMADEKIVSGCYWGNMLVWEEGLIKLEVCRKGRKRCHDGPIVQFSYKDGELWTISMDGRVRIWYYDTIDQADPPDDDRFVQMEPTYDFHTPGASFMCIDKQYKNDPDDTFYFAQDALGGIWRIDLTIETEAKPSERILKSHAGICKSLAVCPWSHFFTTLGIGGRLHLYNYLERQLVYIYVFPARGHCMIWVPINIDASGEILLVGCDDGVVRVCVWKINVERPKESLLQIIQFEKPHNQGIVAMKLSPTGKIFVTAGSDSTIFVFKVITQPMKYLQLVPIGYVKTPDIPHCLAWHRSIDTTIIVGCQHGYVMIVDLPTEPVFYTKITYILNIYTKTQRFYSYKSQILRDILLEEIAVKKAAKRSLKMKELEQTIKENPGMDIDEEVFLEDSESTEKLPELYIPPVPNRIEFIMHTPDDTLWLSVGGYDSGYMYEYKLGQQEQVPIRCKKMEGIGDLEISQFVYSKNQDYIVFAMSNGSIRVNKVNPDDWRDFSNYWQLTMHDNYTGYISGLGFSYDESFFITCGHDGNVFSFRFYPEASDEEDDDDDVEEKPPPPERVIPNDFDLRTLKDKNCYSMMSIEETIVKAEEDRINMVANNNKAEYLEKLGTLRTRFEELLERNANLPISQRIPLEELNMDQRVLDDLEQTLAGDLALVKRKLAFDVEKSELRMLKLKRHFLECMDIYPIYVSQIKDHVVKTATIKEHVLGEQFDKDLEVVEQKIAEQELKGRAPARVRPPPPKIPSPHKVEKKLEYFLIGLPPEVIKYKMGDKINNLLTKYRKRKNDREDRARQWEIFNALKPSDQPTDAEDEEVLRFAEETVGDHKLKSSKNYRVPKHLRETTSKKFKELLLVRKKAYEDVHNFNMFMYDLRAVKKSVHDFLVDSTKELDDIHEEILSKDWKFGPEIFEFGEKDYPESTFEVNVVMPDEKKEDEKVELQLVEKPNFDLLQREVLIELEDVDNQESEEWSAWELEMKRERYRKKMFQQEEIIKKMETRIEHFDDLLMLNRQKRIFAFLNSSLIKCHQLTLYQELMILKDCEEKEDNLQDIVNQRLLELFELKDRLNAVSSEIDTCKKEVDKLQDKEKELQRAFMQAAQENKFFDFLRRIFRKKFRPPKIHTDDDDSSESSSSDSEESEEEDAGSIDSKDFGIIRLDENICPKGCDQNLYELTFQLRNQRHGVESDLKDLNNKIDVLRKDYDTLLKKSKLQEANQKKSQDELETFQREKQAKLNEIFCVIILKLEQIQNLTEEGAMNLVKDSLVISKTGLSNLYKRVGLLNTETIEQKSKHKLCVTHLNRMKRDHEVMFKQIANLKKDIKDRMTTRFGSKVKLIDLEEYMLKRLVLKLRLSLIDIGKIFRAQLEKLKLEYLDKQSNLQSAYTHNTNLIEIIMILKKEQQDLGNRLVKQDEVRNKYDYYVNQVEEMKNNIKKLEKVIAQQTKELEILRREIKIFKTKGYLLKPEKEDVTEEEVGEEESHVSEWEYLDDYMYTECYAKEYWANKAIKEVYKTRQEVIMNIIEELLKSLKIQLDTNEVVRLLKRVISDVMTKCDVEEIINDILQALPIELNAHQETLLEKAVRKLKTVHLAHENELFAVSKEILEEIMKEVAEVCKDPLERMTTLITTLVENIPSNILLASENIHVIVVNLKSIDFNYEFTQRLVEVFKERPQEYQQLLTEILNNTEMTEDTYKARLRHNLRDLIEEVTQFEMEPLKTIIEVITVSVENIPTEIIIEEDNIVFIMQRLSHIDFNEETLTESLIKYFKNKPMEFNKVVNVLLEEAADFKMRTRSTIARILSEVIKGSSNNFEVFLKMIENLLENMSCEEILEASNIDLIIAKLEKIGFKNERFVVELIERFEEHSVEARKILFEIFFRCNLNVGYFKMHTQEMVVDVINSVVATTEGYFNLVCALIDNLTEVLSPVVILGKDCLKIILKALEHIEFDLMFCEQLRRTFDQKSENARQVLNRILEKVEFTEVHFEAYNNKVLREILNNPIFLKMEPWEKISAIIMELVENLRSKFLMQEDKIREIAECFSDIEFSDTFTTQLMATFRANPLDAQALLMAVLKMMGVLDD